MSVFDGAATVFADAHNGPMHLGMALAVEIERRGYSQHEAAEHLGVTPQALSRWINGYSTPRPEYTEPIARVLHTTDEEVVEMRALSPSPRTPNLGARLAELERKVDRLTDLLQEALLAR